MERKELRIGNLVQKGEEIFEADFITIQMAHNYQPIPLNEEWLLKFGFVKLDLPSKSYFLNGIIIDHYPWGYGIVFYNKCKLNYVHQLQNLYFALTNEELTWK